MIAEAGADFVKVYTLLPREAFLAIAEAANERTFPFAGHVPIAVTAIEASDAGQRTIEHYSDSMLPYCSTVEDEVLATLRGAAAGPTRSRATRRPSSRRSRDSWRRLTRARLWPWPTASSPTRRGSRQRSSLAATRRWPAIRG